MIEPVPMPDLPKKSTSRPSPKKDPVVLEDLAALLRLPSALAKIDKVLEVVRAAEVVPPDFAFALVADHPLDGRLEYGWRWKHAETGMHLFAGCAWGEAGHDPVWEVRAEAAADFDPAPLRARGLLRFAAKRAESRFTEWDAFWFDEVGEPHWLIGASAACTRFLEEPDPDATAGEYLAGALHAIVASGALDGLVGAILEVRKAS